MNKVKLLYLLIGLFISGSTHAQLVTLLCTGQISAENTRERRSGNISTTVEFDETTNHFVISNTTNLERAAVTPYKEIRFFDDLIQWQTPVNPLFGNGTFFGSINRKTGEMSTSYIVFEKSGGIVRIGGVLFCDRQVRNRF
jgi:hypothetical protein